MNDTKITAESHAAIVSMYVWYTSSSVQPKSFDSECSNNQQVVISKHVKLIKAAPRINSV